MIEVLEGETRYQALERKRSVVVHITSPYNRRRFAIMSKKYVPPHLRQKQQGEAAPPKQQTSSRWSNVNLQAERRDESKPIWTDAHMDGSNKHDKDNNRPQVRFDARSSNHRQRNVRRSFQREEETLKILFFGDSFIRLFGLVKHKHLKVHGFTGASSKGLGRADNENRATIISEVEKYRPERLVFCFGSVDVHLSYYYTKYTKGTAIDLPAVATSYVEFLASLKEFVNPSQIHVIGVYPSPLLPEHVQESVVAYGVITKDTIISDEDASIQARQGRVLDFNASLAEACSKHGLQFENAYDDMIDVTTNLLKPSFQDVSTHNLHIVWETTVLLWMDRWPWFKALVASQPDFIPSLQETLRKYLETKPWAQRKVEEDTWRLFKE